MLRLYPTIDKRARFGYNARSIMAHLTVYSKPGCHLCEEAIQVLIGLQTQMAFTLEEINIQEDPKLFAEYGEQIPVVLLDGKFLFEYTVDEDHLRRLLQ